MTWRTERSCFKTTALFATALKVVAAAARAPANGVTIAPGMTVDEAEQKLILATLDSAGGNKTRAAEMLGISLKTLHNKLNRFKAGEAGGPGEAGKAG